MDSFGLASPLVTVSQGLPLQDPTMASVHFSLTESSRSTAAGSPQPTDSGVSDLSSRLSRKRKLSHAAQEACSRLESEKTHVSNTSNEADEPNAPKVPRLDINGGPPARIPSDRSSLPAELWQHVFHFLPPWSLGRLLRVNKKFYMCLTANPGPLSADVSGYHGILKCIDSSMIWAKSRRNCDSSIPRPLMHRSELDMWKLILGSNCQFCQKPGVPEPKDSPSWERGPCKENVRLIWSFGIRSCGDCLEVHSMKEVDLIFSTCPTSLIPGLPFALFTDAMRYVPYKALESKQIPSSVGITKWYYKPDVDRLMNNLEEIRTLGPAAVEEWIKGLETARKDSLRKSQAWELWEAQGKLHELGMVKSRDLHSCEARAMSCDERILEEQAANTGSLSMDTDTVAQNSFAAPCRTEPHSRTDLPTRSMNDHAPRSLVFSSAFQHSRPERNLQEVNEAKASRRAEIGLRCLELDPPIQQTLLNHMEAFAAAVQIPHALTDTEWAVLKPRLLAQRGTAERKEQERLAEETILRARSEERRHQETISRATKEPFDQEWEEIQNPIRDRIALYADEIIRDHWQGGDAVNRDNSSRFAAEVLMAVRSKFYSHVADENTVARSSGGFVAEHAPNAPSPRRLVLENMKWVFETKIRPITANLQKELFLCNGCEGNPKLYGFQAVIQHYAAKHTKDLSLGNSVVNWRAEWPEKPPFHPSPDIARALLRAMPPSHLGHGSTHPGPFGNAGTLVSGSGPLAPQPTPVFAHPSPGPYLLSPYGTPFQSHGPYPPPSPDMTRFVSPAQAASPFPMPQTVHNLRSPHQQYIQPAPTHISSFANGAYWPSFAMQDSRPPSSSQPTFFAPPPPQQGHLSRAENHPHTSHAHWHSTFPITGGLNERAGEAYRCRLDETARQSREAWNATSGIRNLPQNVRAHVVFHHVVSVFRERFSENATLALFSDALNNHAQMKPLRNLSGLVCKACKDTHAAAAAVPPGAPAALTKSFTLPAFLSHFQSAHVEGLEAFAASTTQVERARLDWVLNVLDMPDQMTLASIFRNCPMDHGKWRFMQSAFPAVAGMLPATPATGSLEPASRPSGQYRPQAQDVENENCHSRTHQVSRSFEPWTAPVPGLDSGDSGESSPRYRREQLQVDDLALSHRRPSMAESIGVDSPYRANRGRLTALPSQNAQRRSGPHTQDSSEDHGSEFSVRYEDQVYELRRIRPEDEIRPDLFRASTPPSSTLPNQSSVMVDRSNMERFGSDQHARSIISDRESQRYFVLTERESTQDNSVELRTLLEGSSMARSRSDGLMTADRFLNNLDVPSHSTNHQRHTPSSSRAEEHSHLQRQRSSERLNDGWGLDLSDKQISWETRQRQAHVPYSAPHRFQSEAPRSNQRLETDEPHHDYRRPTAPGSSNFGESSSGYRQSSRYRRNYGQQGLRRPHSRFERYEALRQGSVPPHSRSPAFVRAAEQVEPPYQGEHHSRSQSRQSFIHPTANEQDRAGLGDHGHVAMPSHEYASYHENFRYGEPQHDGAFIEQAIRMPGRDVHDRDGRDASHAESVPVHEHAGKYSDQDIHFRQQILRRPM